MKIKNITICFHLLDAEDDGENFEFGTLKEFNNAIIKVIEHYEKKDKEYHDQK